MMIGVAPGLRDHENDESISKVFEKVAEYPYTGNSE